MLEWIKGIEAIVGMLVVLWGGLLSALVWGWGRIRGHVKSATGPLWDANVRMRNVEGDLQTQINELKKQIAEVERTTDNLASKEDVAQLAIAAARADERGVATGEKVDSMHRALMEVLQKGRG